MVDEHKDVVKNQLSLGRLEEVDDTLHDYEHELAQQEPHILGWDATLHDEVQQVGGLYTCRNT